MHVNIDGFLFFLFLYFGFVHWNSVFGVSSSTNCFQWYFRVCRGECVIRNWFTNRRQALRWTWILRSVRRIRCATAGFWTPKTLNCSRYLNAKKKRRNGFSVSMNFQKSHLVRFLRQNQTISVHSQYVSSKMCVSVLPVVDNRPQWIWILRAMHLSSRWTARRNTVTCNVRHWSSFRVSTRWHLSPRLRPLQRLVCSILDLMPTCWWNEKPNFPIVRFWSNQAGNFYHYVSRFRVLSKK